jgi:hypothetical protein
VPTEKQTMVEHGAHHVGGYSTNQAAEEDQGPARGWAEGRASGLQLYEEEGATVDGPRYPRVSVHRR